MKIIEEEVKEFRLVFEDRHGNGYSFPCDKRGDILWEECPYPETTEKSLAKARSGEWEGKNGEVVTLISRDRYGICPYCGRRVYFGSSGWATDMAECDCGQWYNCFGQALKPPEEWEEDIDPFEDIEPYDEYELEQEAWRSHWHEEGF